MTKILSRNEVIEKLQALKFKHQSSYFAMYSSYFGGITKDPSLMLVPVDDHLVHRGDGVFEAIKWVKARAYCLSEHIDRLLISAEKISLKAPPKSEITEIVKSVITASDQPQGLIRLYLSRGPGGFTTNPYDSIGTQLYILGTELKPLPAEKYEDGVRVGFSQIPVKEAFWPNVKSCNYLPNVLMKKEAVDRGLDFTISLDVNQCWAESSTENVAIVDANGEFVAPPLARILRGITLERCFFHLSKLVHDGLITGFKRRPISRDEYKTAKEIMMIGTTLDVISVTEFESFKISQGKAGRVAKRLCQILQEEMKAQ